MNPVSREGIIETWDRLCELNREQTSSLTKQFWEEQPALGVYLAACSEGLGDEAAKSPLIDLSVAIWNAMRRAGHQKLKTVSPEALDEAEEANTRMLEKLEQGSEIEYSDTVKGFLEGYNQRELLGLCLEVLMQNDEEQPELAPDRVGLELLWLKTIIDCLDQAAES